MTVQQMTAMIEALNAVANTLRLQAASVDAQIQALYAALDALDLTPLGPANAHMNPPVTTGLTPTRD